MGELKDILNKILSEEVENHIKSKDKDESYDEMIDRLDGMSEMTEEGEDNEQTCNECGGELNEGICLFIS